MVIKLTPEDIVKRGMWDFYSYYIVGSDKEAQQLLKENKEFEISERDAIVIGLLKVMETDNLIHRFNDYLIHFLSIRSIREKTDALIKKKNVDTAIEKFLNKFPDYWEPTLNYVSALEDLRRYVDELLLKMEKLELTTLTVQNITQDYYSSNAVRKLLNFNNY